MQLLNAQCTIRFNDFVAAIKVSKGKKIKTALR